jgi:hypothetical protein
MEEPIKRKRINNEEELRGQMEKLQIEFSKSKKDKAMLEEMVLEGDKRRAFLDEQIQSRDTRITKLELKLGKEKIAREESEKELGMMSLDWMQRCFELEALEIDFNNAKVAQNITKKNLHKFNLNLWIGLGSMRI